MSPSKESSKDWNDRLNPPVKDDPRAYQKWLNNKLPETGGSGDGNRLRQSGENEREFPPFTALTPLAVSAGS